MREQTYTKKISAANTISGTPSRVPGSFPPASSPEPAIAELQQLVSALRRVAALAVRCADHTRLARPRARLLAIGARADEHLRRLSSHLPPGPAGSHPARIGRGAL
jgi:hypothetical protein